MEGVEDEEEAYYAIPKPDWFTKLVLLQADLIYNSLSFIFSPVVFIMSVLSDSYRRAEKTTVTIETAVQRVPSAVTHGTIILLKRLVFGFFGAAYVCMVLLLVLVVAVVLGVGLVQMWVEEPVLLRERLHFDYTEPHPRALFSFRSWPGFEKSIKRKPIGVPVGHTFSVSVVLLMPESGFNREIGVFQLSAEVLSNKGIVMEKSSLPCMLRFRSLPVRLARTFIMSIPLVLGITGETQRITIEILKHKEGYPRTGAIRVTLSPRAGTHYLPQLHEAAIVMKSKLPWTKEFVRSWKWTFYVWSSLYTYIILLITLFSCSKLVFFPFLVSNLGDRGERETLPSEPPEDHPQMRASEEEDDVSELLRKWRRGRSKRKAIALPETVGSSSASTFTITREETSAAGEEDAGDSESLCLGG
ncbi:Seipin family [Trema orientale]|uniref:Seipin family n=1 Tax=Trema orientale TaxID=63057 RepID=A0A2P5C2D7_TREOI|nr:Seipin family [Trema orientale]